MKNKNIDKEKGRVLLTSCSITGNKCSEVTLQAGPTWIIVLTNSWNIHELANIVQEFKS